jgi:hypothetical protein
MTRKERIREGMFHLLNKQLEIAGVGRTIEELTTEGSPYFDAEYFQNHEIDFEQHQQWLDYAVPYIKKLLRCNLKSAMKEVQMLDLCYGLKFKVQDRDKFFSMN